MRKVLRLILLTGIIVLAVPVVHAQKKGLMASFGGATFKMEDMKYFQEYILTNYPVEGKIISSFPLYTSTSVNYLAQKWPLVRIGVGYVFTTTGGRSDYTDFSGSIHTNLTATSNRVGAFVNYTFMDNDKLDLSLYGRLDVNITKIEEATTIYANGRYNQLNNKYKSFSPNLSAGLDLMYNFNTYSIGIEGGYLVDFRGKLENKDTNSDLYDPVDSSRTLTSDWTGWRAGIKAIFWINN
jgi:hypothetical protein